MTPFEVRADRLLRCGAATGESPIWDERREVLWWIDMDRGQIWRKKDDSSSVVARLGQRLANVALTNEGRLLVSTNFGLQLLSEASFSPFEPEIRVLPESAVCCLNDGIADCRGRFWVGSAGTGFGCGVYSVGPRRVVRSVIGGVGASNGLDWSPDDRYLYHVDSGNRVVSRYRYEPEVGELHSRMSWLEVQRGEGIPDGLTVDASGSIWIAFWGAAVLKRFSPAGALEGVVKVPTPYVTNMAFVGSGMRDLVMTTARHTFSYRDDNVAGDIFICTPDTPGRPAYRANLI